MKRTKRIWALMLTLLMTLCLLNGAAFAEGEEYYWHSKSTEENTKTYYQRSVHRICEGGFIPAIYNIVDGAGKQYDVYCCDFETGILASGERIAYRRLTLENSGYYPPEAASKIRAIAFNSYPVLSLEEMKARMDKAGYTLNGSVSEEQLLSGAQRAIWQYSNSDSVNNQAAYNFSLKIKDGYADVIKPPEGKYKESGRQYYNEINENVQNVYDYLMSLNGKEASPGGIVLNGVQAAPLSAGTSGAVDVLLRFELKNDRHGGITLDEKDDLTLAANGKTFPSREWRDEGNGTYSVTLQGVTAGENIDVTISGEQYLARDAYFYEPVSGRHAAQCFVGVAEGSTPVFARGSFRIDEKTERLAYLSVKKTSNRAGTYKFNVYNVKDDGAKGEIVKAVELTTTEEKPCVASEKILLPVGTYIVEEEDAIKAGYTLTVTVTANGEEHTVNSEKVENPSARVTLSADSSAEVTVEFANCYEERHTHEDHYTPEEPVPAIVVMPKTGDGSVLLSAAGLLLAAAAVCGLKRRIRG